MKRERVINAIAHKETDRPPHNIELTGEELIIVSEFLGIKKEDFFDRAGNHIEKCGCNIGGAYIKQGFYQDEFGVIWDRSGLDKDIGVCDIRIPEPTLNAYKFPEPNLSEIGTAISQMMGNGKDTFKMAKIGLAYFERAWSLAGFENLLIHFHLEPVFVCELLEGILDYNLKIIEAAMIHDIDGFYFGDDYGQQNGLIMSPDTWRKFIKPGLAKMFEAVKGRGKVTALHSCGDISAVMGDLIDIGLDIYQTVQPEVYDLKLLKTQFGNDLCFWGGISTQRLLPFAGPDEIKRTVNETINILADGGGYIVSPTHQVPADVPPENIALLAKLLKA